MTASTVSEVVETAAAEKPTESHRSDAKMRLHLSMIALTGIMTLVMIHLHMDETNAALFSFGPLGPSILTEVIDFVKDL